MRLPVWRADPVQTNPPPKLAGRPVRPSDAKTRFAVHNKLRKIFRDYLKTKNPDPEERSAFYGHRTGKADFSCHIRCTTRIKQLVAITDTAQQLRAMRNQAD